MYSKDNGSVVVDGKTIHILQVPHLNGDCYIAVGMTDEQIEAAGGMDNILLPTDAYYHLTWDVIDANADDESDAADWDDVYATLCQ